MPSRKFIGPYKTRPRPGSYSESALVDRPEPDRDPPKQIQQFEGLKPSEERLWPHLRSHVEEAGGFLVDHSGQLIHTLFIVLQPCRVRDEDEVSELVNHLVSAGLLVKRAFAGQLLAVALPEFETQLDEQLA